MRILIIEDEKPAYQRLKKLVMERLKEAICYPQLDSIEDSVKWLRENPMPSLIFMDIELADGRSFDIFQQVNITAPIIFTTAYDQFAIRAFKVNSLDYLLKPIDLQELDAAIAKFNQYHSQTDHAEKLASLMQLAQNANSNNAYKARFLVKVGDQLKYVPVSEVAWFMSEDGYVTLVTQSGARLLLDSSIDKLVDQLDPTAFFQANRKYILSIASIGKIHLWFNSRMKIDLYPPADEDVIIARDRAKGFKQWLDA